MSKRILYYRIDFVATNAALQIDITEASGEDLHDIRAWLELCQRSIEACIEKQSTGELEATHDNH